MIRNTPVNALNYFYPLGNTPAVSLTQDLPPEQDADILLLGCGDARSILFTCFNDRARKIDVTCCDLEATILARNILLLTLIIDDLTSQNCQVIWETYYHWKIGKSAALLLQEQVTKLLGFSESADRWRLCPYASSIRFCDLRSLSKVRDCWNGFKLTGMPSTDAAQKRSLFRDSIDKAQKLKKDVLNDGFVLSGLRSASPASLSGSPSQIPMLIYAEIGNAWWQHGVTTAHKTLEKTIVEQLELNPMFLYARLPGQVLHYGTHPLEGFPLALSFVPLQADSPLEIAQKADSEACRLVRYAQSQFAAWSQSFRNSVINGSVVRVFVGDAIAFALTMRNAPQLTSNLFCNSWTGDALILDGEEYGDSVNAAAPSEYDVIDTSNLVDHLGPINIMCACADLLKPRASSTLYTEVLVKKEADLTDKLVKLLGSDARLIAFLLGLCPVDLYTNASNTFDIDVLFDESRKAFAQSKGKLGAVDSSGQHRSRLRWKRTMSAISNMQPDRITLEPQVLTHVLLEMHEHMFAYEDPATVLQDVALRDPINRWKEMAKRSNPYYNRSSFTVLLAALRARIETDWHSCSRMLIAQFSSNSSMSSLGTHFLQEFGLYLQLLGDPSMRYREVEELPRYNVRLIEKLASWRDIPSQLCVTLRVPVAKTRPLTIATAKRPVDAVLRCTVSSGQLTNSFCALQVIFGQATIKTQDGEPSLSIREDANAWLGSSDMLVSIFAPTGSLLMHHAIPMVACGLLPTPFATAGFLKDLGLGLELFKASALSHNVFITRYMPGMPGLPQLFRNEHIESTPLVTGYDKCTSLHLDASRRRLESLTQRLTFENKVLKNNLADRSSKVSVDFKSPLLASIAVGSNHKFNMDFPVPVNSAGYRLRIAPGSSYIEMEVPIWDPLRDQAGNLVSPTMLTEHSTSSQRSTSTHGPTPLQRLPLPWTAVRVDLDVLPKIDLRRNIERFGWLVPHGSMMWSTRERRVRNAIMPSWTPAQADVRMEVKEGIYSILMQYTGVQGRKSDVFGFSKDLGGVQVVILPASLRLDLINHSVVIDAAVVSLTEAMMRDQRLLKFLAALTDHGLMQIRVNDQELRSWKGIFPALAERCRSWSHENTCEYLKQRDIPLPAGLDDGRSPICSCGVGKFPNDYLKNLKLTNLGHVLKTYATRMAISPLFPVPFVEDCFGKGLTEADLNPPEAPQTQASPSSRPSHSNLSAGSGGDVCSSCGKSGSLARAGEGLRKCGGCRQVSYCSRQCQRRDWKEHKKMCSGKS